MPLEFWNSLLQISSAIVLFVTFAVGLGVIVVGRELAHRNELRMKAAETLLAEATQKAEDARGRAERANERASRIEIEAAEQRERAAVAERELLALKNRVSDRSLTPADRAKLLEALPRGSGLKRGIEVQCVGGSPEPCAFADALAAVLKDAGWAVSFRHTDRAILLPGASPSGIIISAGGGPDDNQTASAIAHALGSVGIGSRTEQVHSPVPSLKLLVGHKP